MMKVLKKKRKGGFTLIELIVVIAILGILAAIAIPRLGGFSDAANRSAAEADHRIVVSAAQMYRGDTGNWPASGGDLDSYFEGESFSDFNNASPGDHTVNGTGITSTYDGVTVGSYTYE